ncbi:LytR/AlgR family response regulator transcription factor [Brevundimonas sp. SL130]|uniref:LytR/AlgR family response regulator transcription factor n=1 Tax=Brevundimonas sp. SL130 TaxID=2995143 RepID=UPI00226CC774|nr:LytTR family DNA-binding domain-containing protein [Brevundimonas sp. SL130]WAC58797.1 LytTR family DNA-binding domain-containing protein [Brevundimonas sp. SL130]
MRRPTVAVVMAGFTAYSYAATVASVAWYLRRDRPELAISTSLLWAGLSYAPWLGVAALVWGAIRLWGLGWKTAGVLSAATILVVPLVSAFDTRLDLAFLNRVVMPGGWMERTIDRLPIALLLYTAIIAAGMAAAHWRKAREAQDRIDRITQALAVAKDLRDDARLLVSTGRNRTSVDLRAVEWFASAGNYVVVNWDGREGLVRDTLQALETRLDTRLFARIHRSTLVNLARVEGVQPLSDGSWRLTMHSGAELVVSRTYRDAVLVRLGRPL